MNEVGSGTYLSNDCLRVRLIHTILAACLTLKCSSMSCRDVFLLSLVWQQVCWVYSLSSIPQSYSRILRGNVINTTVPPLLHHRLFAVAHAAEKVHDTCEDNKQNTTSRTQSQNLWHETLVQCWEAFLPHDGAEGRPCPVVLGY